MRKLIPLIVLLLISVANAQEIATISIDPDFARVNNCNVSPSFIDDIKESIIGEMNFSPYSFSNLTNSYCYGDNINLEFIFKENDDNLVGKRVSASFYIHEVFDYDAVFTEQEQEVLGYSLKQKYFEYLINGTDEDVYVQLSPNKSCDEFNEYFKSLSGEKYFNNERGYCSIVFKTKVSEIKHLAQSNQVNYAYYFGKSLFFYFSGYSEGNFNLESLSQSLNCELSKSNYYYPEFETDCYGIYKEKGRVQLYAYNDNAYLNVYGIIGGEAKIMVNAYDETNTNVVQEWANNILNTYFPGQIITVELINGDYPRVSGEKTVESFILNNEALESLNKSDYEMNTYYEGNNVSATLSEPYIQVYVPSQPNEFDNLGAPIFYGGRYLVITNNRIYSSVSIKVNNETLAVNTIKLFVDPYIETVDWILNVSVNSGYPTPLNGMAEARSDGVTTTSGGVQDVLSLDNPEFDELEKELEAPSLIQSIANFFKGLFGLS